MIKKIALRDLTEEQYKDWLSHHCGNCSNCFFNDVSCNKVIYSCWIKHKEFYSDEFLNKTVEIETPDILQPSERDYLASVVAPWKSRVKFIQKQHFITNGNYYILITLTYGGEVRLPSFVGMEKMYEGMEAFRKYTMAELGL